MPVAYPQELKDQARELYLNSRPTPEILQVLKVPRSALETWIHRYKWNDIKRLASEQVTKTLANPETDDLQNLSERLRIRFARVISRQVSVLESAQCDSMEDLRNTPDGQGLATVSKTVFDTAAGLFGWGDEAGAGLVIAVDLRGAASGLAQGLSQSLVSSNDPETPAIEVESSSCGVTSDKTGQQDTTPTPQDKADSASA